MTPALLPSERRLWLRIWFLLLLVMLARLCWAGCAAVLPSPPTIQPIRIDPNRATLAELQALPGIGPARARAIVLHRLRHGWFRRLDELTAVDGLGGVTLEELRPFLRDPAGPDPPPGG